MLITVGLVVQLNHPPGAACKRSTLFTRDFTVVNVTGQHWVKIAYCKCKTHEAGNRRVDQIFRQRWMLATWNTPRTAFTFNLLNTFHVLNLQSKCNLFDFYQSVRRQTNNSDLDHLPVCMVMVQIRSSLLTCV
jgi:hypothetical protein